MVADSARPGHAFISYIHEDSARVDQLEAFLTAAGIAVWRDKNDLWPGDDWKIEIRRAIQNGSLAFVACFSENTGLREKSYQNEEMILAVDEFRLRRPGRPWLFPVRLANVDLPEYDLGASKTLNSLQRSDLFDDGREVALGRLAAGIQRIIQPNAEPDQSVAPAPAPGPAAATDIAATDLLSSDPGQISSHVKRLLRDPALDIELDDFVTGLAERAREQLLDEAEFPMSADGLGQAVAGSRLMAERLCRYAEIVTPLAAALAAGCAWGGLSDEPLWARAMKSVASTAPMVSGNTALLELRLYPTDLVMYAAAIGAIHRDQYGALRAVTTDALIRKDGEKVPVIGIVNPWSPFADSVVATAVGRILTRDPGPTDEEIEQVFAGRIAQQKTPVSDILHTQVRQAVRPLIRDDEEYDETFDRAELLLALIATDAKAIRAKVPGGAYLYGGWTGRYVWREQSRVTSVDELLAKTAEEGSTWTPLSANLFGGSPARVASAFETFMPLYQNSRRSW